MSNSDKYWSIFKSSSTAEIPRMISLNKLKILVSYITVYYTYEKMQCTTYALAKYLQTSTGIGTWV